MRALAWGVVAISAVGWVTPTAANETYRWVDGQGRVHYSDTPQGDAEPFDGDTLSVTGSGERQIPPSVPVDEGGPLVEDTDPGTPHGAPPSAQTPPAVDGGTAAALQRQSVARQLRDLQGRIRDVDSRKATLAAARRRAARENAAATGGVLPANIESDEERSLDDEREQLGAQEDELESELQKLRTR